jgi:hypothetical protein
MVTVITEKASTRWRDGPDAGATIGSLLLADHEASLQGWHVPFGTWETRSRTYSSMKNCSGLVGPGSG